MTQKSRPIDLLKEKNYWKNNENKIWLASSISLFRNVEKFNFPGKLSTERQKALITLIDSELNKTKELKNASLFLAEKSEPLDKEYLMEHFFVSENYYQAHSGEAFILDSSGRFLASINVHDHIHFHMIESEGELESAWDKLVKIEMALGNKVKYAFSPRFGFLSSNPEIAGCAMIASCYLQLPALIHSEKIDDLLQSISDESVSITGMQGSPTEVIGDILLIKNNYTLGVNEENILSTVRSLVTKLMVEENAYRTKIVEEDNTEIKDRVSRAFGILMHSYQIDAIEALNALSLIKLGTDFNWVKGISIADMNELFFNCRRAHLLCQFDEAVTQDELLHKRAEFIHSALKNVELTI